MKRYLLLCFLIVGAFSTSCRGSTRCASDERFDESGACVPISSCPSGRDPATGVCVGGSDGGVDGSTMDADVSSDAGPDAGACGRDCGTQYCNTMLGECVDCLDNSQCDTTTPFCSDDPNRGAVGTCIPCMSDAECADRSATPVCDESTGSCEICTLDTEGERCLGLTCTPTTPRSCNGRAPGSVDVCLACASDNECVHDGNSGAFVSLITTCVDLGGGNGVCLPVPAGGSCPTAFGTETSGVTVWGVAVDYCSPVSCSAIRDLVDGTSCTSVNECGDPGQPGPACHPTGMYCTLACAGPDGCPVGYTCNISGTYCE